MADPVMRGGSMPFHSLYPELDFSPRPRISRRFAFKPFFYSGYKSPLKTFIEDNEKVIENVKLDGSEVPEIISATQDKRNKQPKKTGKEEKDDFDSNSYFMLRPLRRLPLEQNDQGKMYKILGKYTNCFNFLKLLSNYY